MIYWINVYKDYFDLGFPYLSRKDADDGVSKNRKRLYVLKIILK